MYQPKKYQKTDKAYFLDFIKQHPFATFVTQDTRLMATHLPFLLKGKADNFKLFSHMANHNEQFRSLKDGTEALVIFQGAHSYVSSSWYREKNISTWDYSAVHVNVRIRLQTKAELEYCLEELVAHFEKEQAAPLFYKNIPKDMLREHLPQITGFWCEPTHMEGIAKLHQGYEKEDVDSVVRHLRETGDPLAEKLSEEIQKEHGL